MAYKPPRDEGVPDALYNEVVSVMQHDVRTQRFSDTMIYFAPMWASDRSSPISASFTLLSACAATVMQTLARGMVCRGSLDMGIAGEFFDGEVYGPALAEVHRLESEVAGYPRIVIGDRLYQHIEREMELTGLRKSLAATCFGLVTVDYDGIKILDYLGSQARKVFPDFRYLIGPALEFVKRELETFRHQGNSKLVPRYEHFLNYLLSRSEEWDLGRVGGA